MWDKVPPIYEKRPNLFVTHICQPAHQSCKVLYISKHTHKGKSMPSKPSLFTLDVCNAYASIQNPRVNALIQSLIQHLHGYIEENHLTEREWEFTWNFFAQMAKVTDDNRNEFLLAADVLGLSQLVELINHQRKKGETGYALVGPFYRANAPFYAKGQSIASNDTPGIRVNISGSVSDSMTGNPISHAMLDIWQAAANGLYESQDPAQPNMNLRGRFTTDAQGHYEIIALMPTAYPVPTDGPVGQLLKLANRPPIRPAHIHAIASKPGYETLVTQIFSKDDETVNSDVVFTANDSMVGHFIKKDDGYELHYHFQLNPGDYTYPVAPIQ